MLIPLFILIMAPLYSPAQERAPTVEGVGELTNQYTCMIQGYTIKVYRPAHLPENTSTRQIHVETHAISFYARFPELQPLQPVLISSENLGFQSVKTHCDRNGLYIMDQNAYYVTIQNPNNYTGFTNDLGDVNLDVSSREHLVTTYNMYKQQHHIDVVPVGCKDGCVDYDVDDPGDSGGSQPPGGGYTTAEGEYVEWDFADGLFTGSGPTIGFGGVIHQPAEDLNSTGTLTGSNGFKVDIYFPFSRPGRLTTGVNISGTYLANRLEPNVSIFEPIHFTRQESVSTSLHAGDTYNQVTRKASLGLQVNYIPGRRLMLTALARGGYMHIAHSPFTLIQQGNFGDQTQEFVLVHQDELDHSSVYLSPGLRLSFLISRNFSLWAGADYLYGGQVEYQRSRFVPAGHTDEQGDYPMDALLSGQVLKQEPIESLNNALQLSAGISFGFGRGR